jgi:predicted dehydrogenase
MMNRRKFIGTAAALAATRSVIGANDRIQMAIIGTGNRGSQVFGSFSKHSDCVFVRSCDVATSRHEQFSTRTASSLPLVKDYRRILDDKGIDAVLVSTPDHWHSPILVDACAAGKDVYCEKPLSNTIEAAQKMVDAVHTSKRVVQIGLQQRSWPHFQECADLIASGYVGDVWQATIAYTGSYAVGPEPTEAPPADLDWETWQGPAPRHAYQPSRQRRWRAFYAYGGGMITDWGVHLMDVVNWYLKAEAKAPLKTSAAGRYVRVQCPEHDQIPDSVNVSWEYDTFVSSFSNAVMNNPDFPLAGNIFYGTKGTLLVNRDGYQVRPVARLGGRGAAPREPEIAVKNFVDKQGLSEAAGTSFDIATVNHTRNFLDCVRSRKTPIANIDVGFAASLPCLLGVKAVREGKQYSWNGQSAIIA